MSIDRRVTTATDTDCPDCPECARPRMPWEPWCSLCGHVFERREAPAGDGAPFKIVPQSAEDDDAPENRVFGMPEAWFFLAVGLLTAPILASTPISAPESSST